MSVNQDDSDGVESIEEFLGHDEDDVMVTQTVQGGADWGIEQTQSLYTGSYEFGTQLYNDVSEGPVTIQYGSGKQVFHLTPDALRIDEYSVIYDDDNGNQQLGIEAYGLTMNLGQESIQDGQRLTLVTDGDHHYRTTVTDTEDIEGDFDSHALTTVMVEPLKAHRKDE